MKTRSVNWNADNLSLDNLVPDNKYRWMGGKRKTKITRKELGKQGKKPENNSPETRTNKTSVGVKLGRTLEWSMSLSLA